MSRAGSADKPVERMKEEIRVMPVGRTPESNTVILRIAVPKEKEMVSGNPVWVQFRIEGFSLGADSSQFARADQVARTDMGQTVHVVVDNAPYFAINEPALNPFNEAGYFYVTNYKFEMPSSLKEGMHTIRMFPARSFGESLKGDNTFAMVVFYLGDMESEEKGKIDFSKPFLTYNEPSDQMELMENQPVLLDFLISNCELSPDGYKVRLTIDGRVNRTLSSWEPYYIYGLSKGKHKIRLELMEGSTRVLGPFNDVERTITIHPLARKLGP
jgi:hypothetical protein